MATREIEVRWDTEPGGMRRLVAECADEQTAMIFMGPALFDESDPAAIVSGKLAELAIAEHRERCATFQGWEAAS
jgi:hypothetical protein